MACTNQNFPLQRNRSFDSLNSKLNNVLKNIEFAIKNSENEFSSDNNESGDDGDGQKRNSQSNKTHSCPKIRTFHIALHNYFNPSHKVKKRQQKINQNDCLKYKIWQSLYGFYELDIGEQSKEADDMIEKNLFFARKNIPKVIQLIKSLDFTEINSQMNQELAASLKTINDYSFLFSQSNYFRMMCSIYWQVGDYLDQIENEIEKLYPCTLALIHDQPLYMDEEFQSVYKTLILWHKTITSLMQKNDRLGYLFGFDKHENLWPWSNEYLDPLNHADNPGKELFNKSTREQRDEIILDYVRSVKYEYEKDSSEDQKESDKIARVTMSYKYVKKILLECLTECFQLLIIAKPKDLGKNCELNDDGKFFSESEHFYYHMLPCHPRLFKFIRKTGKYDPDRFTYGANSATFKKLGLPTIRPMYLYLINTLIDAVHFCNQVQLENKKNLELKSNLNFLNLLSVEVLVDQSRELIEDLIISRQFCYHLVRKINIFI
jgi:hypothetical protein